MQRTWMRIWTRIDGLRAWPRWGWILLAIAGPACNSGNDGDDPVESPEDTPPVQVTSDPGDDDEVPPTPSSTPGQTPVGTPAPPGTATPASTGGPLPTGTPLMGTPYPTSAPSSTGAPSPSPSAADTPHPTTAPSSTGAPSPAPTAADTPHPTTTPTAPPLPTSPTPTAPPLPQTPTSPPPADLDGDGFAAGESDCDDADPAIHPGATDGCDGSDNDCDGAVDEALPALSAQAHRICHSCQEEDTFGGLEVMDGAGLQAGDALSETLELEAHLPNGLDEPVSCAANFAGCEVLEPTSPAGYQPNAGCCPVGQEECRSTIYDDGIVVAQLVSTPDSPAMNVWLTPASTTPSCASYLAISHKVTLESGDSSWPQVAILYWNGFMRLKPLLSSGDTCFGTSVILPPFLPVDQPPEEVPRPELHPVIDDLYWGLDASSLPWLEARGAWYDLDGNKQIEVSWTLAMSAPEVDGRLAWTVSMDATLLTGLELPASGGFSAGLGLGALSSMYASADAFDADVFQVDEAALPAEAMICSGPETIYGEPAPLAVGSHVAMLRTTSSDHNSTAPDVSIGLVDLSTQCQPRP